MERSLQPGGLAPRVVRRDAPADIVLACEHASRDIPAPWSGLGLDPQAARSHAAREDARLADAPLATLGGEEPAFVTRRNEPYGPDDGVTYTLLEHGIARGLPNVMLEVRNDPLVEPSGVERVAGVRAPALARAVREVLGPLAGEARAGSRIGAATADPSGAG